MNLLAIQSNSNPIVRQLRSLHQRKARQHSGMFLAEGPKIVEEALRSGETLLHVLLREEDREAFSPLLQRIQQEQPAALCYVVNDKVLHAVSDAQTPQGIVAAIALPPQQQALPGAGFGLYLDALQDPGNVGAMLRSADALGVDWLLLGGACADPYAPKTIRAAMGSTFHLPIYQHADGCAALRALADQGYLLLAADLHGASSLPPTLPGRTLLMIGNEGRGLSAEALALADLRYRLPMKGRAESLNAAACAAILLYECALRLE